LKRRSHWAFPPKIIIRNSREHQLDTEHAISHEHVTNNDAVRTTLLSRGIHPESLAPAEDVDEVECRISAETRASLDHCAFEWKILLLEPPHPPHPPQLADAEMRKLVLPPSLIMGVRETDLFWVVACRTFVGGDQFGARLHARRRSLHLRFSDLRQ
jgi:hypothetical protein